MRWLRQSLLLGIAILASAMVTAAGMAEWHEWRPCQEVRDEADECVSDAFNCLAFQTDDHQHRVFSDLRKALERDPIGTVGHIVELGKLLDRDDEYAMPKPMPRRSGLPMPKEK